MSKEKSVMTLLAEGLEYHTDQTRRIETAIRILKGEKVEVRGTSFTKTGAVAWTKEIDKILRAFGPLTMKELRYKLVETGISEGMMEKHYATIYSVVNRGKRKGKYEHDKISHQYSVTKH